MSYIVYRMENSEGRGPFTGYREKFDCQRHNDNLVKYPGMWRDIKGTGRIRKNDIYEYIVGCRTWKEFLSWFNPIEIKNLKDEGYIPKKFRVSRRIIGKSKRQVFFRREDIIEVLG